jgi:hypothetical protein
MEGISKYLRLRITAVAALVAAGLVLMAMCASASALVGAVLPISLGIRDSSKTPIKAEVCTTLAGERGYYELSSYERHRSRGPCGEITHTYIIQPGGRAIVPNSITVGVMISNYNPHGTSTAHNMTLDFAARNRLQQATQTPGCGDCASSGEKPYFVWGGWGDYKKVFDEGQAALVHVNDGYDPNVGVSVELRRYHDQGRDFKNRTVPAKLMRIEIRHWPGT